MPLIVPAGVRRAADPEESCHSAVAASGATGIRERLSHVNSMADAGFGFQGRSSPDF